MNTIRSTGFRVTAVVALIGVVATAITGAVTTSEDDEVTIEAVFTDASPMVEGNEVKASGVTVGEISKIELEHGRAHVEMSVERSVLPLYSDARATITLKDILGERYIKLERGSKAPQLNESELVLPDNQTTRSVDMQQILNAVDKPTGAALAALVTSLGEGVNGQGKEIAAGIRALAPAMRQTDELGRILSSHNRLLVRLLDSAKPVLAAIAKGRGEKLDRLVGSTERTLTAVAQNRAAVQATLQRLPATLVRAQRTLAQVAGVSEEATPTLAKMRPVVGDLPDISRELQRFADSVDPALASLTPVLDKAEKMLDEAAPLVKVLRPAGDDIRGVAATGRHLMEEALSKRLVNLMEFIKGWALSTTGYDGLSHYFRGVAVVSPKGLATTGLGPVPGAPEAEKIVPDVKYPKLPIPPPLGPKSEKEAAEDAANQDSATGLTEEQENSMVEYLLGGR